MRKLQAGKVLTLQFHGAAWYPMGTGCLPYTALQRFYAKQCCRATPMCCGPADVLFGDL